MIPVRLRSEGRTGFVRGHNKAHGDYKDDMRAGPWAFWRSNGTHEKTGEYVEGEQHGVWTHYDAKGVDVVKRQSYDHGKLVK